MVCDRRQRQSVQFVRYPNMQENSIQNRVLDRRISVAPMMDWTDSGTFLSHCNALRELRRACLLYVSSQWEGGRGSVHRLADRRNIATGF